MVDPIYFPSFTDDKQPKGSAGARWNDQPPVMRVQQCERELGMNFLIGIGVYAGIMTVGLGFGLWVAEMIERAKRKKRCSHDSL